MFNRVMVVVIALAGCAGGGSDTATELIGLPPIASPCDYTQAFGNGSHTGAACPEPTGLHVVATITQDPDADAENAQSGFLQIHESPPLTSGDWVVIPSKSGFTDISDRSTERYGVQVFKWSPSALANNAVLVPMWKALTDWQPVDGVVGSLGYVTNGYVQQFAPAIANGAVYMPARKGKVVRIPLAAGTVSSTTLNPFVGTAFDGDDRVIVNSAVSADASGTVYYTAVAWPLGTAGPALRGVQARGTWIVQIKPSNAVRLVDFDALALAAGMPGLSSPCEYPFGTGRTPKATGPDSKPPIFGCGKQRPALNAPVAIDESTGHLVVYSYANNAQGAAFLTEIDPVTMTPVHTSDTRGHAFHGCGARLAISFVGDSGTSCDTITAGGTTHLGFDPDFNGPVRFRGEDIMDSAPTIAPNGDRSIGSYDGGFTFGGDYDARCFGVVFHATGAFAAKNERSWWEVTPSVWRTGADFHYLQDQQLYSDLDLTIAQLDQGENIELQNDIDLDFNANAIDFLDAHIPFDATGTRYAINGDGHLYKFGTANHGPLEIVPLTNSDGTVRSMETLSGYYARDRKGRIYASYAGNVYVIDGDGAVTSDPKVSQALVVSSVQHAQVVRGMQLKFAGAAKTAPPAPPTE